MEITKTRVETFKVIHSIASKPYITFGKFVELRKSMGLSTAKWEQCFGCDHSFKDDEEVYIGSVTRKGNIFFCKECAEKYNTEEEKGETN